ncbi:MAG: regulatory signaling modulator protein AmpE [Halioglobus sp.]
MTFLAIVFALLYLKIQGESTPLARDDWFYSLQSNIRGFGLSGVAAFSLYIAIPVVLALLLFSMLEPLLFGLIWIVAAVVVLLYAFGRQDFPALAERYRNYCLNGDFEAAYLFASSELGLTLHDQPDIDAVQIHEEIERALLYAGYQRWFAVLFYFLALGPVGALAYRLAQLSSVGAESQLVVRVLFYADWIPARLLAAGFSLTGDFLHSRDALLEVVTDVQYPADSLLLAVGRSAIGSPEATEENLAESASAEVADLQALLSRSAIAWMAFIAVLVLLS